MKDYLTISYEQIDETINKLYERGWLNNLELVKKLNQETYYLAKTKHKENLNVKYEIEEIRERIDSIRVRNIPKEYTDYLGIVYSNFAKVIGYEEDIKREESRLIMLDSILTKVEKGRKEFKNE